MSGLGLSSDRGDVAAGECLELPFGAGFFGKQQGFGEYAGRKIEPKTELPNVISDFKNAVTVNDRWNLTDEEVSFEITQWHRPTPNNSATSKLDLSCNGSQSLSSSQGGTI